MKGPTFLPCTYGSLSSHAQPGSTIEVGHAAGFFTLVFLLLGLIPALLLGAAFTARALATTFGAGCVRAILFFLAILIPPRAPILADRLNNRQALRLKAERSVS